MGGRDVDRVLILGACACLACALTFGCRIPGLVPDMRTPADRAREVEPRCAGFTEESVAALLSPSSLDSVQPAYSYVQSGPDDHEARLRGARLEIKPLPGFSREALTRSLECHEARVTLGQAAARADDPYVLPGAWVDIDVDSKGDGFVVLVRTDQFDDARRVLERARRFAGAVAYDGRGP